jgi:acetolactate synthase-1/3 small subunit
MIKIAADMQTRAEILRIVDIFRAKVVDVTPRSYSIEVTGAPGKIDAMIELLRPLGLKEIVRSGPIVLGRGPKAWRNED